jgi:hypothetical protein
VEVSPELVSESLLINLKAILAASIENERAIDVCVHATENLPGHLNGAIQRCGVGMRYRWVSERSTQSPAAEYVPVGNAGDSLQFE